MKRYKSGFTLIELLVVVGMIAVIMGAISTSFSAAQNRARINKATNDVKVITQASLAYENYSSSGELPTMDGDADAGNLAFLIGKGGSANNGEKIPALLMASLQANGKMLDPWGQPYQIRIQKKSGNVQMTNPSLQTGYFLPNFYRLSKKERSVWAN